MTNDCYKVFNWDGNELQTIGHTLAASGFFLDF
jgi:hypothetical protein